MQKWFVEGCVFEESDKGTLGTKGPTYQVDDLPYIDT